MNSKLAELCILGRIIKEATEAEYSLTPYKGNCGSYQINIMREAKDLHMNSNLIEAGIKKVHMIRVLLD